ncbi:helix-turn-helix transcriptional regulator [Olsenella sp. DNF00959]|uniref:helix-turn-helix transcriptional regulator n=1 Tax=Olsenella sp. DNF00959 TaxID=1476999 RepID=UPI000786408C|nr:helix-turn-helix transcriptional regulator [Olsenella sp. DNF00959]KXB63512.1 DNA-binding helix-turn-helix protein [Olsenella sp. DNF00959]
MKPVVEEEIAKLQDNLPLIRNAGGWSAEEFGDMIGVTKQTVRNLETKKTRLSKTQYIAIRAVLDYELEERPDDQLLASAVNLSMNSDDLLEPEKNQARAFVEGATRTGLDQKAIVAGLAALIGAAAAEAIVMGPIASVAIGATADTWLSKIIKRN